VPEFWGKGPRTWGEVQGPACKLAPRRTFDEAGRKGGGHRGGGKKVLDLAAGEK